MRSDGVKLVILHKVAGALADERITGEANGSRDGQALKAKVDVGRVK
jgi:hypothetical protein